MTPEGGGAPGEIEGFTPQTAPSIEASVPAQPVPTATASPPEPTSPASPEPNVPSNPDMVSPESAPPESSSRAVCGDPNYPSPQWSPTTWTPYGAEGSSVASLLSDVHAAIVGHWQGLATTPWTTPYVVDITFEADGHYSARCADPALAGCCLAFYYGTDDDTPLKQWRIDGANLSGQVFGQIDIAFDYRNETSVEYGLPAWQGELSKIERNATGDGLRFEFATSSGYGPLRYDLRRIQ